MSAKRSTRDPKRPAYDNPVGNKGKRTDLSHGGEPPVSQNAKDAAQVRGRQSSRRIGHPSDGKLGQKPPRRKAPLDSD